MAISAFIHFQVKVMAEDGFSHIRLVRDVFRLELQVALCAIAVGGECIGTVMAGTA